MRINRRQFLKRSGVMAAGAAAVAVAGVPEQPEVHIPYSSVSKTTSPATWTTITNSTDTLYVNGLLADQDISDRHVVFQDGAQVYKCTFDHCTIDSIDPKADIHLISNYFAPTSPVTWIA